MEFYRVSYVFGDECDTFSSDVKYFVSVGLANTEAEAIQRDICDNPDMWIHPKKTVQTEQPSPGKPFGKWEISDDDDTSSATFTNEGGYEYNVFIEKITTED